MFRPAHFASVQLAISVLREAGLHPYKLSAEQSGSSLEALHIKTFLVRVCGNNKQSDSVSLNFKLMIFFIRISR